MNKQELEVIQNEITPTNEINLNMEMTTSNITQMTNRLNAMSTISKTIKAALVNGIDNDYAVIPGTGKPSLLQPGARKICLLFGLVPFYEVQYQNADYDKVFTVTMTGTKKLTGEKYTKTTESLGTFNYVIRCILKDSNNRIISTGIGQCTNKEKGKTDMAENSVLKLAKKRALIDAVLGIADMSSAFTQDLEDKLEQQKSSKRYTNFGGSNDVDLNERF